MVRVVVSQGGHLAALILLIELPALFHMAQKLLQVSSKHLQAFGAGRADVEGTGTANAAIHMLSLTTGAAGNSIMSLSARRHEFMACEASVVPVRKRGRIQHSVGWQWCPPLLLVLQEEGHARVVSPLGPGLLLGLLLVRNHGDLVVEVSALRRLEGLDRYSGSGF